MTSAKFENMFFVFQSTLIVLKVFIINCIMTIGSNKNRKMKTKTAVDLMFSLLLTLLRVDSLRVF